MGVTEKRVRGKRAILILTVPSQYIHMLSTIITSVHLYCTIPYGRFQILREICDIEMILKIKLKTCTTELNREAVTKGSQSSCHKAKPLDRNYLLNKREQQHFGIYFTTQYGLWHQTHNHQTLEYSAQWSLSEVIVSWVPILFFLRRAPTLKDSPVRSYLPPSKLTSWFPIATGTFGCGSCKRCSSSIRTSSFINVSSQKNFQSLSFANCNTTFEGSRIIEDLLSHAADTTVAPTHQLCWKKKQFPLIFNPFEIVNSWDKNSQMESVCCIKAWQMIRLCTFVLRKMTSLWGNKATQTV